MTAANPRYDAYAYPIQPLVDAEHEILYSRAFNAQQRQFIFEELEKLYRALLRRQTSATVTLRFTIKDGMLLSDVFIDVGQRHVGPQLSQEDRQKEYEALQAARSFPGDTATRNQQRALKKSKMYQQSREQRHGDY